MKPIQQIEDQLKRFPGLQLRIRFVGKQLVLHYNNEQQNKDIPLGIPLYTTENLTEALALFAELNATRKI